MNQEAQDYYNTLRNNRTINPYVFDLLFEVINGNVVAKNNMSIQLFNGLPLVFDAQVEARLFGQLYSGGLNAPSTNAFLTNSQTDYINPFLKKFIRNDEIPVKIDNEVSIFEHPEAYKVDFTYFDEGSTMMEYYNTLQPEENQLKILYEADNSKRSNLFGSFTMVKMGKGYLKLLNDLKAKQVRVFSHIGDNTEGFKINSYEDEFQDNYKNLLKRTRSISSEKFSFAFETEMRTNSETGKLLTSIFGGYDSIVIEVTEAINNAIESAKFTEKEYKPQKSNKETSLEDYLEQFIEVNQEILEAVAKTVVPDDVQQKLLKAADIFLDQTAKLAKNNLPPETIAFFEKVYKTFDEITSFYKDIATYYSSLAGDSLYLLKAFLMGFVNGLLSTIQAIISVIGWLLKSNADKKLTGQFYLELQSKFEFIEDLFDLVSESSASIFNAIRNLGKDFSPEKFKDLLTIFKGKANQIDRFDTAYFAGIFIFEVVLGVILIFFTGGAAAVVQATNAAEKATAFLKIFAQEMVATATLGISAIMQLFRMLITKFVQACKNGWLELKKFLDELLNYKVEDIAKNDDKVDDTINQPKPDDELTKLTKLQKMWDDFTYDDLIRIPPPKRPCFLAGILIKTNKGHKKIEDIVKGDLVWTYNFEYKNTELKPVTEIFTNVCEKYIEIHTQNDVLKATGQHRFWIPEKNKWIKACDLLNDMQFINFNNEKATILDLQIIDKVEKTYNFEVEHNHNYYVGLDEILSHNKTGGISKFASMDIIDVEFYKLMSADLKTKYIGQTIQGFDKRFVQHKYEFKIRPLKKPWMKDIRGIFEIEINGQPGPFKMTPYEAAVTEMFEINTNGGIQKNGKGLFNKQNPISRKKFEKFKDLGFNPCKFYV